MEGKDKADGLHYVIQYRKRNENLVTDALFRCHEEGSSTAITIVILDWYQEVTSSYEADGNTKELF